MKNTLLFIDSYIYDVNLRAFKYDRRGRMQQPLSSQPSGRALLHVSIVQGTTQRISTALSKPRNTKISSQLPKFYFTAHCKRHPADPRAGTNIDPTSVSPQIRHRAAGCPQSLPGARTLPTEDRQPPTAPQRLPPATPALRAARHHVTPPLLAPEELRTGARPL